MDVGVLGGGVAGLASAHYLQRAGHRPIVIEASETHGDLTRTVKHGSLELDAFTEFLHGTDTALIGLLADLNALDRLVWRDIETAAFTSGAVRVESAVMAAELTPLQRLRGLLGYLYITHGKRYVAPLDRISAADWITRVGGRAVYERIVRPLLRARFGDYAEQVPASVLWTHMNRARWSDRAVRGYVRGGYRWLAEQLRGSIEQGGGEVLRGTPVTGLELEGGQAVVHLGDLGERLELPLVVSTLRPHELAKIARGSLLADLPVEVPYQAVVSALLVSRAPLDRYLTTLVLDPEQPFHMLSEATHVVPLRQTGGRHLFYFTRYCAPGSEAYRLSDDVVGKQALELLGKMYPSFDRRQIEATHVARAPAVSPLWTVGSLARKPPFRMGESPVYLCSTAQAYPRPMSWDTCVMLAREVVSRVTAELG